MTGSPSWPQFRNLGSTPWWELLGGSATDDTAGPSAPPVSHFPLPGWPAPATVEYLTKLIVLALILLALPYLIGRLVLSPGQAMGALEARALAGPIT